MKLTRQRFEKFLDKDYLKDIEVTQAVKTHKVFSEINDVAEEFEADLIVMGSQGTAGVKEVFVGSNTEKVVRTSNCPVLVIKERISNFKIDKAVFVTDFELDTLTSFMKARTFFKAFNVVPKILFINIPEIIFEHKRNEIESL